MGLLGKPTILGNPQMTLEFAPLSFLGKKVGIGNSHDIKTHLLKVFFSFGKDQQKYARVEIHMGLVYIDLHLP